MSTNDTTIKYWKGREIPIVHRLIKVKEFCCSVHTIKKACMYRGKGGDIMCAAVFWYIESNFIVNITLSEKKIKKNLLDNLNENLWHPNGQIQVWVYSSSLASINAFIDDSWEPSLYKLKKLRPNVLLKIFICTFCDVRELRHVQAKGAQALPVGQR